MYVCMNIKCGSMSPFLNLVHRFKLYKCKLAVKSVCMGDPHDPAPHPLPFVQVRWCLLVLLICFCFLFFVLIWSCLFFLMKTVACVEVHCGTCMCCGRVCPLPPRPQPTFARLPASGACQPLASRSTTTPHSHISGINLFVCELSLFSSLSIPSFLKQVCVLLRSYLLSILCVTHIKCFIRELISW